jgi:hypothetical protein
MIGDGAAQATPLDKMRGRGEIIMLSHGADAATIMSVLDTAYDDKVMSARAMRVVIKCGAWVDDRCKVTYDIPTGTYDITVWQWSRGKKRTKTPVSPETWLTGDGTVTGDTGIFEPYPYVTEI